MSGLRDLRAKQECKSLAKQYDFENGWQGLPAACRVNNQIKVVDCDVFNAPYFIDPATHQLVWLVNPRAFMKYTVIATSILLLGAVPASNAQTLCPDGSYVGGSCSLAPDGTYVGGKPKLAPDGTYVGGKPTLAPDGSYVGGKPRLAPDGTYVGGDPALAPDGSYVGETDGEE